MDSPVVIRIVDGSQGSISLGSTATLDYRRRLRPATHFSKNTVSKDRVRENVQAFASVIAHARLPLPCDASLLI